MDVQAGLVQQMAELHRQLSAQPIFDRQQQRYAVELLYRDASVVTALQSVLASPDAGLVQMFCRGINDYVSQFRNPVFFSVSSDMLLTLAQLPLDAANIVIELSERKAVSGNVIQAIRHCKRQGYRFALDDIDYHASKQPLMELADYIKINIQSSNLADISRYQQQYSRAGLTWLAECVETEAQFQTFKALGFELFQGYFLPERLSVANKNIEPSVLKLAQLIGCLFADEPDINLLTSLLSDEPTIVIGMLSIANSPLYRKTREVSSVKEMTTRLGLALMRKWVLMYAVLGTTSSASAMTVLTRAYTAQYIAEHWQLDAKQCQQYFLAALISGTDLLFGIQSELFLPFLNVNTNIDEAISKNTGPMANALTIIQTLERGLTLKIPATDSELPYVGYYNKALADVQQNFAEARR